MNSKITKLFAALIAVLAFALNACDKEEQEPATEYNNVQDEILAKEGIERNPIVIDGKKQEWTFPARNKTLSKGIILNEANYYSDIESILKELV